MKMVAHKFTPKFVSSILLTVALCIFMFAQIITTAHTHEYESSLDSECAICALAAQNDDLDIPNTPEALTVEISNSWIANAAKPQPVNAVVKARARAPPYS